jgi:hypothetical protein
VIRYLFMFKKITLIALPLFCFPFYSISQKNHAWELEGGVLASNRILSPINLSPDDYYFKIAAARSEILPGGYFQTGINLRADKRLRPFIGVRVMNQQVQLIETSESPNAPGDSSPSSTYFGTFKADMVYLYFPVTVKYDLVQKPNFRLTTELGFLPGILGFINNPETLTDRKN